MKKSNLFYRWGDDFFKILATTLFILNISNLCLADTKEDKDLLESDILNQAVFAKDVRSFPVESENKKELGLVSMDISGLGFVYKRKLWSNTQAWAEILYKNNQNVLLNDFQPSQAMAYATITEHHRTRLIVGMDQILHLTNNRYWGVVVGAGLGYGYGVYKGVYYPQLCTLHCGFDPKQVYNKDQIDSYAFATGRLGFTLINQEIWGIQGNLTVVLAPKLYRYPKLRVIGVDGRSLSLINFTSYFIEATIPI